MSNANTCPTEDLRTAEQIATTDIRRLFDGRGRLLPPDRWPPDVAVAVELVGRFTRPSQVRDADGQPVPETVIRIQLKDRLAALETLMRHYGMFEPDTDKCRSATDAEVV